ncbi:MAG: pitrilysin family protein [Candidatus Krumholzibacteriia bacterium]
MRRSRWSLLAALAVLLALVPATRAQGYLDLEDRIQEFTLDNGITFIVLERHDVPVFSFRTYMSVGSANEVRGVTGIAHILEHMAFKGTDQIGTSDYKAEKKAMAAEDAAFAALKLERNKGERADPQKLAELEQAFSDAKDAAREYVVSNEFGQIVESNGGVGLNASTWTDETQYFYSLPSNRLELWGYLEGNRMARPVLREFYTEKDGPVTEERRMRTDNSPFGRLLEQLQNLAFMANGYHHSTIGYMSDIETITRADCQEFYDTHYIGPNMTIAIVGDVQLDEVKRVARKYFSAIPGGEPQPMETLEPDQLGEKRIVLREDSQPVVTIGYKVEGIHHPDDPVYSVIADILGQGRTSRLYTSLVKEQNKAVQAMSFAGYPGKRHRNLLIAFGIPTKGVTAAELEGLLQAEIDKLVDGGVTEQELEAVKQRTRANFVRGLRGNNGMAGQLAFYQGMTGDWRNLFDQVDAIEAVTLDDVQRVAAEIFQPRNRTVALIENEQDS